MNITSPRSFSALALVAALAAAPLAATAAGGMSPDGAGHHQKASQKHEHRADRESRGLRGLDLSQDQKDQIFKIRHDQEQAVYEQKKALRAAAASLRELGQADSFDQDKARQAAGALGQAQSQLALLRAQSAAQVRAVLTPGQRQQLADAHQQRKNAKKPAKS